MNIGKIQGYMLSHCENRQSVIDYLSTLDIDKEQKNKFYLYWKSAVTRNTIKKQMSRL